jgi:hypothetical protein
MLRFLRWDAPAAPLVPLLTAIAGLDPARSDAEATLLARTPPTTRQETERALLGLLEERRIAQHGAGPFRFSHIADASGRTHDFAVECTLQEGAGLRTDLPRGKLVFAVAVSGSPRIDGHPPGWIAVPPAQNQTDTVTGGSALLVHFIPGNAIAWGR